MKKTCTKCGEEKDFEKFSKDARGKHGLYSYCKKCVSKRMRKAYTKNPEKFRKRRRDWRKSNPELAKAIDARRSSLYGRFAQSLNNIRKNAKAGGYKPCDATAAEIEAAHDGRCDICGVSEDAIGKKLCADHNHETGKFRGWLCRKCNAAIGFMDDSETVVAKALNYLISNR